MSFSEKIRLLIDVDSTSASSGLGKLKTDLKAADGAFAKTKVASKGLWDGLKANAGTAAIAAGTAVVGFGIKSVKAFQDVALAAGELADASGLSVESASRLMEVADKLGVPVDGLAGALNRMNREAGASSKSFDAIGAAIVRNKDGTVNIERTFLNAVGALQQMPDATERAAAAQKIFGRGWQQMSELVMMGSQGIQREMAKVGDAQVITDDELLKARAFRDALDNLQDSVNAFGLSVGQKAVPALTDLMGAVEGVQTAAEASKFDKLIGFVQQFNLLAMGAKGFRAVKGAADELSGAISGKVNPALLQQAAAFEVAELAAEEEAEAVDVAALAARGAEGGVLDLAAAEEALSKVAEDAAEELRETTKAMDRHADAALDAADAQADWQDWLEDLPAKLQEVKDSGASEARQQRDLNRLWREGVKVADSVADSLREKAKEQAVARGAVLSENSALRVWNRSMLESARNTAGPVQSAIVGHIAKVNHIPKRKVTDILADTKENTVDHAENRLNKVSRARNSPVFAALGENTADHAENRLNSVSRSRAASIVASASTSQAEADLNYAARTREARIHLTTIRNLDSGGTAQGGELMAERRPELVRRGGRTFLALEPQVAMAGDQVTGGHETARILRARRGGGRLAAAGVVTNNNYTINVPAGGSAVQELRRYARRNGLPDPV